MVSKFRQLTYSVLMDDDDRLRFNQFLDNILSQYPIDPFMYCTVHQEKYPAGVDCPKCMEEVRDNLDNTFFFSPEEVPLLVVRANTPPPPSKQAKNARFWASVGFLAGLLVGGGGVEFLKFVIQ